MSIVKSYHGDFNDAENYLSKSLRQFNMPENKIPYISYFIAAGLIQEYKKNYKEALQYFKTALEKGNTQGLYIIPPELYYAHTLVLTGNLVKAKEILDSLQLRFEKKEFTASGYFYYKYDAELLKAQHDYPGYAGALQTFYEIKDSLTNLNRYREIEEVETKYRVKEEQQKVTDLQKEEQVRVANMKREKIFYISIIALSAISILLLLFNIRHRQIRNRQNEILQQNKITQIEEQNRIAQMKSSMDAEENERQRIADKLHDDVGAMLSLASINISSLLENKDKNEQADKKLSKVNDIVSSVSAAVRGLSHELTPLMIEKFGIVVALKDMANTINLSEKIKLETILIGFDNTAKYSPSFLKNIYRITQELLHNVIAHANATHAILELIEHPDHISLMVEDNGGGIKQPVSENGLGLNSIRSKIDYLHGSMEINGNEEGGTIIVIEFPA